MNVTARCIGCGATRSFGPDDVAHGDHPMCEVCFMPMIAVVASTNTALRRDRRRDANKKKPMTADKPNPEDTIADAVWSYCIRTGKAATAKDLAAEVGKSATWVRKHWDTVGCRADIVADDVYVERREKSYGTRLADQRVDALRPTWQAIAKRLHRLETSVGMIGGAK